MKHGKIAILSGAIALIMFLLLDEGPRYVNADSACLFNVCVVNAGGGGGWRPPKNPPFQD